MGQPLTGGVGSGRPLPTHEVGLSFAYHWVNIGLEAGCPTSLAIHTIAANPPNLPQLVECLTTALSTQRWRCALDATCAVAEFDTLP